MSWVDALSFAISSVRSSWVRSALTVLGFATGVGAVLTVLALGDAGEARVEAEIAKLGVNKVWIRQRDNRSQFQLEDAQLLYETTGAPACASAYTACPISINGYSGTIQVVGFDEGMQTVHALKMVSGRTISAREFRQGSLVCIIDERMLDAFRLDGDDEQIYVGNRRFTLIGVVEPIAGQFGASSGGMLLMPLKTYLETFDGRINEIILNVRSGQRAESVAQEALDALASDDGFHAETLEEEINAAREVVRIFVMVLMVVAAVCMLTGGIGVMNVMLLAVRERRQEIGMLKAVGATSRQIHLLFIMEAVMYASLGGCIGIGLGICMTVGFGAWIGIDGQADVMHISCLMFSVMLLGLGFGVLPAMKAARLEPVDALRSE